MYFFNLRVWVFIVVLGLGSLFVDGQTDADPVVKDPARFDPKRPLSQELQTSVADGFRLVAVGDCIISRPLSQYASREPGFAQAVRILKEGDATYGNLETSIVDMRMFKGFPYTAPDDVPLLSDPAVAADLAGMGFDLMSRANNHALDWGIEGMRETTHWTDAAGLITAGIGENEALARAARYYESAKGRVGIVAMASTYRSTSQALPQPGAAPGRPGVSSLAVKKTVVLPLQIFQQLEEVVKQLYPESRLSASNKDQDGKLTFFDTKFEAGTARALRYEMDEVDFSAILKAIRQGKEHSDFLLVTIHSHEPADTTSPEAKNDFADTPAEFVHTLAKAAIDAGADAFVTTGIHHLGPIEIYKGRPIFYGLGDFFWSDIQEPMPADFYAQYRRSLLDAFSKPERVTDADLTNALNAQYFAGDLPFESVITESRFVRGRVAEIRLYPVDMGYGRKLTESGLPRTAAAEKAMKILQRLQSASSAYGTRINIESFPEWHYVGVIRQ
jgi:poly-gamma-glutamate capsule biosynthesis protein CapA/YwtB (metallophosphatase superfamily)